MRHNVSKITLLGLMICLASGACALGNAAEENRYTMFTEEGVRFRYDNQTNELCKFVKTATGFEFVKVDVVEPKPAPVKVARQTPPQHNSTAQVSTYQAMQPIAYKPQTQPTSVSAMQTGALIDPVTMPDFNTDRRAPAAEKQPASGSRQLGLWDGDGNDISNKIDDADRTRARTLINSYDALHVSHTLKTSGDRIKGIVIIENKGHRKIAMMELTMTLRVIGKEKAIEYKRFLFADKAGADVPPAPSFGNSGMSVLKTVDIPTPSGVINGMPEIRVSFLRFDDQE